MSVVVTMHQAKTDLSKLVRRAEEGEEVIITRGGKPIARLVPVRQERVPGSAQGMVHIGDDFDAPLPDEILKTFERG